MEETLSFDDVLIKPRKGIVTSRKDINISTTIGNLKLNMPLISLNMDTVTETDMAIAMARQGGIGMVHRFMTIEEQVNIIKKVKRSMSLIIENPYHIDANKTALEAKDEMEEKGIGGLLVTDDNKLVGIITTKDLVFQSDQTLVRDLMTKDLITANLGVTQEEAKNIMHKNRIEKLPVLDNGRLIGLISSKDIRKRETFTNSAVDSKGRLIVGAAVGVVGDYLERTKALIEAGADAINIDVAHGHSDLCINATKQIKEIAGDVTVISGNVATYEGFLALANAGADAIRVGVGNGCFAAGTRILMAHGTYKNIEEITPGDKVINKEGNPVNVKKSFCTGIKKVSKLRNSIFYSDTYVTPDHKYFVGDLNTNSITTIQSKGYVKLLQSKTSKFKWKQVNQLKQDVTLIPKNINFELNDSFEIVLNKKSGGNWKSGFIYEKDYILTPSYELGYILGTFLGDGHAFTAIKKDNSHIGSVRWYFGKNEIEFVNKLTYCIKKVFNKKCSIRESKKVYEILFYYKPLADFLTKFGKNKEKHLPSKYIIYNLEYLQGLLDGLINSDGHIESSGRITFANTSKKLIELFNVVNYLITGVFPNNNKINLTKGNLKNANLDNFNQVYTSRINTTANKRLTKDYQIAKILENKETELSIPVYDLEIDCPTHSFIANNSIVHNSICITRIVTGCGVPQISAITDCYKAAKETEKALISEGGTKNSGDVVKAIIAGSSAVAIGSQFAGTDESPGKSILRNGRRFKLYRGSTSFEASVGRKVREKKDNVLEYMDEVVPEGVESYVPYKGSVNEIIHQILGGIKSGMSYCGVNNLKEAIGLQNFIKITSQGMRESKAHDVDVIK